MLKPLTRLAAKLRGSRHSKLLRQALGSAVGLTDQPREAVLKGLVSRQLAPWHTTELPRGRQQVERLQALNSHSASVFVFELGGRHVDVWPKPSAAQTAGCEPAEVRMFSKRVNHYRTLLSEVLRHESSPKHVRLAVDLRDIPADVLDWPVFGFQKAQAARNLLLPDVDFFHHGWYLDDRDNLAYTDKAPTACFVGASSGMSLSADAVRRHASQRLALASAFVDDPRVLFRIAGAVQCESDEARQLLMAQPYFCPPMGWQDQLKHRFLISVDGNGATCSRVVKSLRSHSVLVKFPSDQELYYFPLLEAGRHYLHAKSPDDVRRILDEEAASPGCHAGVASAGQRFAAQYLQAPAVFHYTQLLMRGYAARVPA